MFKFLSLLKKKVFHKWNNNAFFSFIPISILDLNSFIPDNMTHFQRFILGIIILLIISLWSIIDIIGHFWILFLVDHTKVKLWSEKYPKLNPILNYFKKINYYFLIFEILFVIIVYSVVIFLFIYFLYLSNVMS